MKYRLADAADVEWLAHRNGRLIRDEGHRNRMTIPELQARMAGWLAADYRGIVFEDAQGPIGYALFRDQPEYVDVRQFFVRSECRRRGFGRAAIAWLRENAWTGKRVRIEVLSGNAVGIAFWRAVGFRDYCLTLECD